MAVSLYCPNCGENLGKDIENPKSAYCSTCGTGNIKNERGYVDWENHNVYVYDCIMYYYIVLCLINRKEG